MTAGFSWPLGGLDLRGRNEAFDRGMERFDSGDYGSAIEQFEEALSAPESDAFLRRMALFRSAEARVRLAREALERHDRPEAQAQLTAAVEINPRYPDLHYLLALANYGANDLLGALESVDIAIECNPVFARARVLRGAIHYTLGHLDRGVTELESALRIDPSLVNIRDALRAHESGDSRAALKAMLAAIQPAASEVELHQRQGEDHFRHGRYEAAATEFLKALDLSPAYADIHNKLGVTLAAAGRKEQALECFNRALEHNGAYADAWINQGELLAELGNEAESQRAFRRAAELDPENEIVRAHLRESGE